MNARLVAEILIGLLASGALLGCASLAPDLSPPSATASGLPPARPAAAASAPSLAQRDTVPSPEAEHVLASIPEPLAAAGRSAPPRAELADSAAAPAARDSSSTAPDSSHAAVPIPAPTTPLGDRPGSLERIMSPDSAAALPADSAAGRAVTPPVTNPPTARSGAISATTAPGASAAVVPPAGKPVATPSAASLECFRLQVGAPADPHRAEQLKKAAESQLELSFDVKKSSGLYKVRSHDCLNREAVDHLRARALAAGFHGVFAVAGMAP